MDNPTDKPERSLADEATQIVGRAGGFSFGGLHPVGVSVHDPLPASAGFPGQARAAVLLTFDVEGNYGNGLGEVSRELDNYRRICDRLDRLGLVATFNVVGQMVDDHGPGFVKVMHQAGSEVASHGYWHDLNRRFGGPRVYAGQYGPQENYLQVTRGVQALEAVLPEPVRGIRMPYGHFNEYTYEAIEHAGLHWTSNVGIDDFIVPGQGFGPRPFTIGLGEKVYSMVEIPLDTQTFDWPIWMADEVANAPFVKAVRRYCTTRGIAFNRSPAGAATIWRRRIDDAVESDSVMTLLCHPTNLAVHLPDDPLETFLLPVFEYLARLQQEGRVWVCTCGMMERWYRRTKGSHG